VQNGEDFSGARNLVCDWVFARERKFEKCRQTRPYRIHFFGAQFTAQMPDAEFCRYAGVRNVAELSPIGLLSENPKDLTNRSPVALSIHDIRVGQSAIYVEDDQLQVAPKAFQNASRTRFISCHNISVGSHPTESRTKPAGT